MRYQEFYRKYKIGQRHDRAGFSSETWWKILAVAAAILIDAFIAYKRQRVQVPFSLRHYGYLVEGLVVVVLAFALLVIVFHWRALVTYAKGYGWIGTFEVQRKYATALSYCLVLRPGQDHVIRVNKTFFDQVNVGDSLEIKRDALGMIAHVRRTGNYSTRLRRLLMNR